MPALVGVTVPPSCCCPPAPLSVQRGRGAPVRSSKAHFRSTKLCAAAGFGSRSLRLCVMYIQQNNLGLDRTFPSPNFVEPQTSNFGKNQVLLSGCHPCGLSSTGADQLLANSLVHREGFGWALPAWERGSAQSLWLLCHHPAWEGTFGQHHCIILSALASKHVVSAPCQRPRLDSLLHASKELHCQHVSHGQSFHFLLFFFLFS